MNFKKSFAALTAGILCCSVMTAFGMTASAEPAAVVDEISYTARLDALYATTSQVSSADIFKEYKTESGVSYSATLAKQITKYNSKTSKTKKAYAKTYTKKFNDKIIKAYSADSDKLTFHIGMRNADTIVDICYKSGNCRMLTYMDDSAASIYVNDKTTYILDPTTLMGYKMTSDESALSGDSLSDSLNDYGFFDMNFDSETADVFAFKVNDKKYTYEHFTDDSGLLFNEKGTPVMIYSGGEIYGFKFSTTVKDSVFKVPTKYTVTDISDMTNE